MRNLLLIIAEMLVCYSLMLILSKKYKTDGLYVYGIIATFTTCIMSLKSIDIMNIPVPIGFASSISIIVAGNLITQKRGPEELKTYLSLILITSLVSCSFLNLSGLMEPSKFNEMANNSFNSIFKYNIRMYLALIFSIIISTYLSSKIYYLIKRLQNKIILSNIFSIIIVEFIDNVIFVLIAYLLSYETIDIILCIVFRYMIKTLIGLLGTIPLYISNKFN
jgi:hypothetical protein